ncbi:hypothetical protein CVT26_006117 [Gymnopilus dilepis]|uniref:Ino eighty subunit 1 n=1 Tax=Gymnopilus dilepis TaxID=231916 RepID=A0A409WGJ7_9AGAR|nr:hypothetical protein CVT26_006117 [Gymnopilus dilepis]
MAVSATTSRRGVAIKRADGEPLTRVDLQYDFLRAVFDDQHEVFTDPYAAKDAPSSKVTFRDLYIKAILHSPRATKALKDKMTESSVYAEDFAMLSLLVNVGRVNTTMSFFPEMKTAIRTYHPVPSLQRTNGNMQDAPRIKHILKTSLLEDETKAPPATPADILARCKSGQPPSTSVTNLMFVLAHHSGPVGHIHFDGRLDFTDLFIRTEFSSWSRSRTFLWLCYHYLESSDEEGHSNPFADPEHPSGPPPLIVLTPDQASLENRESPEDSAMTAKLVTQRIRIIESQAAKDSGKISAKVSVNGSIAGDEEGSTNGTFEDLKAKTKRTAPAVTSKAAAKRNGIAESIILTTKEKPKEQNFYTMIPDVDDDDQLIDAFLMQRKAFPKLTAHERFGDSINIISSRIQPLSGLRHSASAGTPYDTPRRHRYSPYNGIRSSSTGKSPRRQRSLFERTWQIVKSADPVDSDEEMGDEEVREDYLQRLRVIGRFAQHYLQDDPASYRPEMDTDIV